MLSPGNVVSAIVGDAEKYAKFKDLKTERDTEIRHFKTIAPSVASRIMGLNGEHISTIQQSCLASITLHPGPGDGMIIHISGGSGYEVEVAKLLMEGFIGFSALDGMSEGAMRIFRPPPLLGEGAGEPVIWF